MVQGPYEDFVFHDEHGRLIDYKNIERNEQIIAREFISPDASVLELGARYGTVSCTINRKLNDKTRQVVIEPDHAVLDCLKKNRDLNQCQFHIVYGVISNHPMNVNVDGYGTTTCIKTDPSSKDLLIPNYTLKYIEHIYNMKFDTLVADCEGCLERFMEENEFLYDQLKLVTYEKDQPNMCNYDKIGNNLRNRGFVEVVTGFHTVWVKR